MPAQLRPTIGKHALSESKSRRIQLWLDTNDEIRHIENVHRPSSASTPSTPSNLTSRSHRLGVSFHDDGTSSDPGVSIIERPSRTSSPKASGFYKRSTSRSSRDGIKFRPGREFSSTENHTLTYPIPSKSPTAPSESLTPPPSPRIAQLEFDEDDDSDSEADSRSTAQKWGIIGQERPKHTRSWSTEPFDNTKNRLTPIQDPPDAPEITLFSPSRAIPRLPRPRQEHFPSDLHTICSTCLSTRLSTLRGPLPDRSAPRTRHPRMENEFSLAKDLRLGEMALMRRWARNHGRTVMEALNMRHEGARVGFADVLVGCRTDARWRKRWPGCGGVEEYWIRVERAREAGRALGGGGRKETEMVEEDGDGDTVMLEDGDGGREENEKENEDTAMLGTDEVAVMDGMTVEKDDDIVEVILKVKEQVEKDMLMLDEERLDTS